MNIPGKRWIDRRRGRITLDTEADRRHYYHYLATVKDQLWAAREGLLSTTWREDLVAVTVTAPEVPALRRSPQGGLVVPNMDIRVRPMPTPGPRPVFERSARVVNSCLTGLSTGELHAELAHSEHDLLRVCAQLDAACVKPTPALWEPYAAAGNWRAALDAWFAAAREAHTQWIALLLRGQPGLRNNVRSRAAARNTAEVALYAEQGIDARYEHDRVELAYRAGLATGTGIDNGWRDWLTERMQHWRDPAHRDQYRLALLDHDLNSGAAPDPYGASYFPAFSVICALPKYWTASTPLNPLNSLYGKN